MVPRGVVEEAVPVVDEQCGAQDAGGGASQGGQSGCGSAQREHGSARFGGAEASGGDERGEGCERSAQDERGDGISGELHAKPPHGGEFQGSLQHVVS
ncbi:hypothetical protein ACGFZQ_35905 [Streptomyces sp. NPDC048254]|uniref:hypothetical protein n=1 Tax=Streptomyces sp. NPDC048254 TaxID=3365525 RepID=UPI003712D339